LLAIWQQQLIQSASEENFIETDSFSAQESWINFDLVDYELGASVLEEISEDQDFNSGWMKSWRGATLFQFNNFVSCGYANRELTSLLLLQRYTNLPPPCNSIKLFV